MVNEYANTTLRDAHGNIIGYQPVSASAPYVNTDPSATDTAAKIAAEVGRVGGVLNPYVAAKAVAEGYTGSITLPVTSTGQLDTGISTVPVRSQSEIVVSPIVPGQSGETTTIYVPYGSYAQTKLENVKLLLGGTTGELGIYQQPAGHSLYNLVGGGGRAALQSGMFTVNAPETPYTVKQIDVGTYKLPSGEGLSRLGAEVYGGFVTALSANKTVETTAVSLSTYTNVNNLANYVNPQGVNLPKSQAPGVSLPWEISSASPAIQYVNEKGVVANSAVNVAANQSITTYQTSSRVKSSGADVIPLSAIGADAAISAGLLQKPFTSSAKAVSGKQIQIGESGLYGDISTLKVVGSSGNLPIVSGSLSASEKVISESKPTLGNFLLNVGGSVYNEASGLLSGISGGTIRLPEAKTTYGFRVTQSDISYKQSVSAPYVSLNKTGYRGSDITIATTESSRNIEPSIADVVNYKIGGMITPLSPSDTMYSASKEATALTAIGGYPAAYAYAKSFYVGAYAEVREKPVDVVKYFAEVILISGAVEAIGAGVTSVTTGTKLEPVLSAISKYKLSEIAVGSAVTYGVASDVTQNFTDFSVKSSERLGGVSVGLVAMGASGLTYSNAELLGSVYKVKTAGKVPSAGETITAVSVPKELTMAEFNKLSLPEKETYNLYGTTNPLSNLLAKQAFERRTESAIRVIESEKGDVLTRAYESYRKEPAVAPWEREPDIFDLKTLRVDKIAAVKTPEVTTKATSLIAARELISRIAEPSTIVRGPALESWERAEILKKLYPEEYAAKPILTRPSIEFRPEFTANQPTARKPTISIEEPLQQISAESLSKTSLQYKEPVDVSKLNRLLTPRGEFNILTESEVKSRTASSISVKRYDWNIARKMATVDELSPPSSKVLLQLQPRATPASKTRTYAEVSPYTSIPSELELSAMREYSKTTDASLSDAVLLSSDVSNKSDEKSKVMLNLGISSVTATETRTTLDTKLAPETRFESVAKPITKTTTIIDTLPKYETLPPTKPSEVTTFDTVIPPIIPPFVPSLPGSISESDYVRKRNPFRKIQREILYIGPKTYMPTLPKRTSKKKKK